MWTASDIAIVMGASGVLVTTIVNAILSYLAFKRAGQTHDLVNGLSEKRQEEAKAVGKAEGKEEGRVAGDQVAAAAIELTKVAITTKAAEQPPAASPPPK